MPKCTSESAVTLPLNLLPAMYNNSSFSNYTSASLSRAYLHLRMHTLNFALSFTNALSSPNKSPSSLLSTTNTHTHTRTISKRSLSTAYGANRSPPDSSYIHKPDARIHATEFRGRKRAIYRLGTRIASRRRNKNYAPARVCVCSFYSRPQNGGIRSARARQYY